MLLERTMVRAGNEEYVKANGHYGLTTLRSQHVRIGRDGVLQFRFVGKSGVVHRIDVDEPRLAELVRRCRRLSGDHLFQYVDGGGLVRPVTSQMVNRYLRDAGGADVTAKDFRTWMATLFAAHALAGLGTPSTRTEMTRTANTVIDLVADRLQNTCGVPGVVHPPGRAAELRRRKLRRALGSGRRPTHPRPHRRRAAPPRVPPRARVGSHPVPAGSVRRRRRRDDGYDRPVRETTATP